MHDVVFIATYNERETIEKCVSDIFIHYPQAHVLVIDDSSPDGTAAVVQELQAHYPHLKLLVRKEKTGLGDAYKHAFSTVVHDPMVRYVFTMDADGSHHPTYISTMLNLMNQADLVVGSRYVEHGGVEGWELWRSMLSKYGNLFARIATRVSIADLTSGFICIRRDIAEKIDFRTIRSSGYSYQIEFKHYCVKKLKARVREIPIIFYQRKFGNSKMSWRIVLEGIITPIRLFFSK